MINPEDAKDAFLQHIQRLGQPLDTLIPANGIALMLDFYTAERVERCAVDQEGDMLLYQWGTYQQTYAGQRGEWFDFNITRQLMFGELVNTYEWEGELLQISLNFKFPSTPTLQALSNQNRWCSSLHEITEFKEFIFQSPAYAAVAYFCGAHVSLDFESAE